MLQEWARERPQSWQHVTALAWSVLFPSSPQMKQIRRRRTARYDRHQASRYGALLYTEITGIRLHGEGRTWDV
eukprot:2037829-Rhodomonas_salina.1